MATNQKVGGSTPLGRATFLIKTTVFGFRRVSRRSWTWHACLDLTRMKNIWYIVNTVLVTLALRDGYTSMAPESLRHTNPEPLLCVIILLIMPFFALGSVYYSIRRWKHDRLARPTWDRNPLNWWHDPLQSLFISTCVMAATAIGAALRRPVIGSVGFWTFGGYCSFAIGLLVGQLLVYRIYRGRIIEV
jgi:hypothetical protein